MEKAVGEVCWLRGDAPEMAVEGELKGYPPAPAPTPPERGVSCSHVWKAFSSTIWRKLGVV